MENVGDPEIEEIKELIRAQQQKIDDTNRLVHKLHRGVLWGRFFTAAWWILILAVSGVSYYLYVQPYVNTLEQYYGNFQQGTQQAQSWEQQAGSWFKSWIPGESTSTAQ